MWLLLLLLLMESITDVVLGNVSGERGGFPVVVVVIVVVIVVVVVVIAAGVTKVIEMALETPRSARLFHEGFGFRRGNQAFDPRVAFVAARGRGHGAVEVAVSGAGDAPATDGRRRHVTGRGDGIGEVGGVARHALRHQIRTGSADRARVDLLHHERRSGRRGHAVTRVLQEAAAVIVVVVATFLVQRVIAAVDVGHGLREGEGEKGGRVVT